MRLILIRHAEPDYVRDSLTEKGWREAELLSERVSGWDVTEFFCSPLGRAKDTASKTLKKMNRTAVTADWLSEFMPGEKSGYRADDIALGIYPVGLDFGSVDV